MNRAAFTTAFFLLVFSLSAWSQDNGLSRGMARTKAERPSTQTKIVVGKVAEITNSKLVIENEHGAKKELKLDAKTRFLLTEKQRVKLTEVQPGWLVSITFREADLTATKVQQTMKKFQE